jgi:hypothetical protein
MAQPQMAAQAAHAFRELRRWPRLKIHVPVTVVIRTNEKTVFVRGRGQDLNEGGIGVFVGAELRVGDVIEISFTPPYQGNPMTARTVVRNRRGYTYGLVFVTETTEDQKKVELIRSVLRTMRIE